MHPLGKYSVRARLIIIGLVEDSIVITPPGYKGVAVNFFYNKAKDTEGIDGGNRTPQSLGADHKPRHIQT